MGKWKGCWGVICGIWGEMRWMINVLCVGCGVWLYVDRLYWVRVLKDFWNLEKIMWGLELDNRKLVYRIVYVVSLFDFMWYFFSFVYFWNYFLSKCCGGFFLVFFNCIDISLYFFFFVVVEFCCLCSFWLWFILCRNSFFELV